MKTPALLLSLLALGALGLVACGGDDDDEETEATAGRVTVTTSDTGDGRYTWEVSPTPTAETILVNFKNESKQPHALVFARLGDEPNSQRQALALQLKGIVKGDVMRPAYAPPKNFDGGQQTGPPTGEIADVTKPLYPGDYVMLCPLAGKNGPHYKLGQLAEFAIE